MSQAARFFRMLGVTVACTASVLGCDGSKTLKDRKFGLESATDAGPVTATTAGTGGPTTQRDAGKKPDVVVTSEIPCTPAVSSDRLRPRDSVMSSRTAMAMSGASGVFTRDLFNLFRSNCGACHVDQALGGFHVGINDFSANVTVEALHRMTSDEVKYFMPPPAGGGKPFSSRDKADPVVELASLIEAWLAAGKPMDVFYPPTAKADAATVSYLLTPELGMQMTNIGSCVPDKKMVGMEQGKSASLDVLFAAASALPERLDQTDLVSFDSAALARQGIVAFAPAYTLWADNAKKIRMVRVPRGQSITFDKAAQSFSIPANTRFYKTFLKRVIDLDGHESYRKMETRLIVSRPDEMMPDGSRHSSALFGTYAWNEKETEAVLVQDPLRNGKPFRDRLVTYVTDEQKADAVIAEGPANLQKALEQAGVTRTYAIPGSERCIQCHMGSPGGSFVLGFIPLQIHRRPLGEGGVIEPADRDELNQLQRLIDYGVITGMTSPDDVAPLEDSQGDRKPRNQHELEAQGYMLGNCAHCHNPYGFPSVSAPELRDVLNFMPSSVGGVFQFPLEKTSPRIFRGPTHAIPIHYITPSVYDGPEDKDRKIFYAVDSSSSSQFSYLQAPWRSLIYRNVDTPYSYVEDSTIYPHMPRNTAGYDCRARQLMASWMVSIPAQLKPALAAQIAANKNPDTVAPQVIGGEPQAYVEVKPGDPNYSFYQRDATFRLNDLAASPRFKDCPTGAPQRLPTDPPFDIQDPRIRDNPDILAPIPVAVRDEKIFYSLPIPMQPHWFVTDLTDAPGDWYPRRPDWHDIIVAKREDLYRPGEKQVIDLVNTIAVSGNDELRNFALTDVPFGLWVEKTQCDFPSVAKVADIPVEQRPQWMNKGGVVEQAAPEAAHVYSISPGAQVFTAICRNCHGPQADARSRLADTIADLTGGATRVGNLRDGVLGPVASPGANRMRVFGEAAASTGFTVDDWSARYLAWMTLGGTQRTIPSAVLSLVANTYILGERRTGGDRDSDSIRGANMLQIAQFLCEAILPVTSYSSRRFDPTRGAVITGSTSDDAKDGSPLIYKNGDGAMWERLCTLQNPLPVRVATLTHDPHDPTDPSLNYFQIKFTRADDGATQVPPLYDLFHRDGYSGPVGDHQGSIRPNGIDTTNLAPWCIRQPNSTADRAQLESFWQQHWTDGSAPPYCPAAFLSEANRMTEAEIKTWSTRAAMNAGMTVFLYLDALTKGQKQRVPDYDHCEELHAK